MSQSIRFLPAVAPAEHAADAAHRDRDLRRLLAVWRSLAVRFITAQAHGGADEVELCDALTGVEEALRHRHRKVWRQVQPVLQLLLLEAEHAGDQSTAPSDCLNCRRAVDGLPSITQLLMGEAPR
ncbi:hypothetical protein [Blastococcus mobilis]|uniref:Uncharacterized protein n=1 Tax=Blastococcus mobilis TaxID=1938746 RepID=A0A238ZSK4_9ACTN|nr:hypothetical protein [Blastococcus mobilis]SNR85918.1 hypothetical protein SAMN06272737_13216 [Blastococcus mobilis]